MKSNFAERQAWITAWLKVNFCADAVNEPFHEAYHKQFPEFKRAEKMWGAQPVAQAQSDLKKIFQSGLLERGRIGLGANWQPGFPTWVYGYTLKEQK